MFQSRTGRFTAVDPVYAGLFNPQGWNRYSYALNSPLNYTDVTGLNPACVWVERQTKAGVSGELKCPAPPPIPQGAQGSSGATSTNADANHRNRNYDPRRRQRPTVSTSTVITLPESGQIVEISDNVPPMLQLVHEVSNTTGSLTSPLFYATFFGASGRRCRYPSRSAYARPRHHCR
jgi:hypothetical protein